MFDDISILSRKLDRLIEVVEHLTEVCEKLNDNLARENRLTQNVDKTPQE